jgi:hypothetical protein
VRTLAGEQPVDAVVAPSAYAPSRRPDGAATPVGGERSWRLALVVLFGLGLCLFAYAWLTSTARPGATTVHGWWSNQDQRAYLVEARGLSHLKLTWDTFVFGPAWPAIGAVWLRLGFSDPFVVTDALAFAASLVMTAILGRRLRSAAFGLAAAGGLALATPLLRLTVEPWNTTVTVVAVLVVMMVGTRERAPTAASGAWIGAAVGLAFAARYIDGPMLVPLAAWVLLRHGRTAVKATAVAVTVSLAFILPVLAAQNAIFGSPFRTPYAVLHAGPPGTGTEQGFGSWNIRRIPRSFVEVFVTGTSNGVRTKGSPLGVQFPWAIFAPFGAYALVRRRHRQHTFYLVALATSALAVLAYCSFHAVVGASLIFDNVHYFKAWFPLWALLAAEAGAAAVSTLAERRPSLTGSTLS